MTEHLPECPCQCTYDCGGPCICDALRACEVRVKRVCKDTHATLGLKEITRIAAKGYDMGERDALEAAVKRVEDYLQHDVADGWMPRSKSEGIITVLKGEQ